MKKEQKEETPLDEIIKEVKEISKDIERIKPLAITKQVKKFNKSGHIILPKEFVGSNVMIIKFPGVDSEKEVGNE